MSDAELLLLVESRKKSGVIAALLNLFIPGAGYMYCGRWILGIFAFFFVIVLFVASLGFAAIGIALLLIIDGFLCAGRYNKNLVTDIIRERASAERTTSTPSAHPASARLTSVALQTAPDTSANLGSRSCPECGETVLAVARKCKHCGSAIEPIAHATEVVPEVANTAAAPATLGAMLGRPSQERLEEAEGSGTGKILAGIAVAVLVLGALLWFGGNYKGTELFAASGSSDVDDTLKMPPPGKAEPAAVAESAASAVAEPAVVEPALPGFDHYPVEVYVGPTVPPEWMTQSEDGEWEDANGKPTSSPEVNFAGIYHIGLHSCGTSCRYFTLTDVSTGRSLDEIVSAFSAGEDAPTTTEGYTYITDLAGRSNSKLLVAQYNIDSPVGECRERAFVFENEKLTPVSPTRRSCTEL